MALRLHESYAISVQKMFMISVLGEKESIDASEHDWKWNERFQNVKNAESMISYINQGTFISAVIIIYYCYYLFIYLFIFI